MMIQRIRRRSQPRPQCARTKRNVPGPSNRATLSDKVAASEDKENDMVSVNGYGSKK
jgi:hypothetical protein